MLWTRRIPETSWHPGGADADYADPTATAATDATAKAVRPPAVRTLWELAALQDAQAIRELSPGSDLED